MRHFHFLKTILGLCASAAFAQEKLNSAHVDQIQREMSRLARDPARATEILGEGWTVVDRTKYVTDYSGRRVPYPVTESYLDTNSRPESRPTATHELASRYRGDSQPTIYRNEFASGGPGLLVESGQNSQAPNPFKNLLDNQPLDLLPRTLKPQLKIVSKIYEFELRHPSGTVSRIRIEDALAQTMGPPHKPSASFVKSEVNVYLNEATRSPEALKKATQTVHRLNMHLGAVVGQPQPAHGPQNLRMDRFHGAIIPCGGVLNEIFLPQL